ncbi:WD40 repeat-containing protein [Histoplasma capsulatum var. duboisii H88]|uniref:WD40 repeat-containing protein n=1 Tax=Ajellomyces capsulatus (strain H88) TaxID=544711 RepID=F0UEN2_AJEC8|nr:WD40 repeat-containing protein [Histoplasma capsulatum var. duboisii H88]
MVDQSDVFYDQITSSLVQATEVMTDSSLPDDNKQHSSASQSGPMDQQTAHPNLGQGLLPSQGDTTSFSHNLDPFGILGGPAPLNNLLDDPGSSIGAMDYDTQEGFYSLDQVQHSASPPQLESHQHYNSGQTHPPLGLPSSTAGIENDASVSGVANSTGQLIANSSLFTMEASSMVSAPFAHHTNIETSPIYPGVFPHAPGSNGDDEDMGSMSGEEYYDDYDDDDDDDDGDSDDEDNPAYGNTLIEDSDLYRFSSDRLPRVPSIFGSSRSTYDDSNSEINDTEKFYITDDEISCCDPTEYSNPMFDFGSDVHDSGVYQSQVQNSTTNGRSQPISFTNFENSTIQSFTLSSDADEDDHLDFGGFPQTETVSNFISQFSIFAAPSKGIFLFRDSYNALFVNDTTITFLAGLDMTDAFLKSHDHTKESPHFVLYQTLPWPRTSASPQVTPSSRRIAAVSRPDGLLTEDQYTYMHGPSEESIYYVPPSLVLKYFSAHIASSLLAGPLAPCDGHTYTLANGLEFPAFEKNLTVEMFIKQWLIRSRVPLEQLALKDRPHVTISDAAADVSYWPRPHKITRPEKHQFKVYDIQNIPWSKRMSVRRSDARILRDSWYKGYRNLIFNPHGYSKRLPQTEKFFMAKTMYTKYKASMSHFQLRNLMSVTSSNTVQYAHRSKIYTVTPFHNQKHFLIDLSNPSKSATFFEPVKISTMKAKHGVTVVGGFSGEYAMRGDVTDHNTVDGYITKSQNGITNHIDIVRHRTSRSPQAIISSNDQYIRILDCETNKFVQNHRFARAINCTDTSLDGRLRVIVGDAKEAWIIDSESGKPVQPLVGHQDFGFACAWSPDMLHVATSNQDGTVNIWDALNAQTYQTRQVHDFFGEIGGADYTPDGGRIWVANMDHLFGGLMEFDRCQWGQEFGIGRTRKRYIEERLDTYYPDLPNEWLPEADLDDDERCALGPGERKLRFRRLMGNREHADLLC